MLYSDKKNKTNPVLPYSTLKPEINSDSPSLKSNGARLVSEIIIKSQIKETGVKKKYIYSFFVKKLKEEKK